MKSTLFLALTATVLCSIPVVAEENQWPSVTASSMVTSKYLGFGTGNVLSKDPAVQSDLFISWKNGLYLDLWNSRGLKGTWNDSSLGNEVDYKIGWKGQVAEKLTLNVAVTYFDEPSVGTFGAGDILYTYAYLTKEFKHLSVTAGYENFTTMPESGFHGGNLFNLGVSKSQSLCKDRLNLQASAALVYDTGTLGSHEGLIARGNVAANWNITKRLTFNVIGVNWYAPITAHDKRTADTVLYSGLTFKLH